MVQKDSGGQKPSCGHVNVRVSSGKAGNPGSALKTGCLHNLVEGHGQVLSRETGQGPRKAPRRERDGRAQVRRMSKKMCRGRQGRREDCQASVERPTD